MLSKPREINTTPSILEHKFWLHSNVVVAAVAVWLAGNVCLLQLDDYFALLLFVSSKFVPSKSTGNQILDTYFTFGYGFINN